MQKTETISKLHWFEPIAPKKIDDPNLDHLFDILEKFEEENDPLSLSLHRLATIFISLDGAYNNKALIELLTNPLDDTLIVDVMQDEDGWLWERRDLDDYLEIMQARGLECLSPYTNQPLKAYSHPFASAMSHWLNSKSSESESREITKVDIQQAWNLKLLKAKQAVYRKKFKTGQEALLNSINKTNNNTFVMQKLVSDISKQAKQNEQHRTELLVEQMEGLKKTVNSAEELIKSRLDDAEKALKAAVEEQEQLKQTLLELEEQRELNLVEQERNNLVKEALVEQRVQVVEKIYMENVAVNNAKIQDVHQHVNRLEERSDLQLQQIATQEERVRQYEIELGQVRAKAYEQEAQINRLDRKVRQLRNWPF